MGASIPQAELDLLRIYDFTELAFGQYQADAHHAGLERSFELDCGLPAYRAIGRRAGFDVFVFSRTSFSTRKKQATF